MTWVEWLLVIVGVMVLAPFAYMFASFIFVITATPFVWLCGRLPTTCKTCGRRVPRADTDMYGECLDCRYG